MPDACNILLVKSPPPTHPKKKKNYFFPVLLHKQAGNMLKSVAKALKAFAGFSIDLKR